MSCVNITWRASSSLGNGWRSITDLDLFGLVMGDVEKELLANHPSKATIENVMEEAITIAEVTEEAVLITPTDPTLDKH